MRTRKNHIVIFEHQAIWIHKGEQRLTELQLKSLQSFYGEKGVPYFDLIHNGVKFNAYVGVIRVGNLSIEILPKADNNDKESYWKQVLISMLKAINAFEIHTPSESTLNIKINFILDLYFEIFIREVEYLFKKGLIKKYRKKEENIFALKGRLLFGKQISNNLIHQERFFVQHSTYDRSHLLHQIIHKTLLLLKDINSNALLSSRIGNLLLNFPEVKSIKVTEMIFDDIVLNRKTDGYKNSLEISRLLLLNYHPDLSNGKQNVLALMFDMNLLWEKFIYVSLRKHLPKNVNIRSQSFKYFWKSEKGNRSSMRPDIVISKTEMQNGKEEVVNFVLDTKWKKIDNSNPTPDDLRQLYVYHEYFTAKKVALIYPGIKDDIASGTYYNTDGEIFSEKECSIIKISVNNVISNWQKEIEKLIFKNWI